MNAEPSGSVDKDIDGEATMPLPNVWKPIAIALMSAIITIGVAWVTLVPGTAKQKDLAALQVKVAAIEKALAGIGTAIKADIESSNDRLKADLIERFSLILQSKVSYPYLSDKQVILGHINDENIHEPPARKEERIRNMIRAPLATVDVRLEHLEKELELLRQEIGDYHPHKPGDTP